MAIESILVPIDHDDDPDRCQSSTANGQCIYKRYNERTDYCARHNGKSTETRHKKKETYQYRLKLWQENMEHFAGNPKAQSLKEEVGILRLVLEQIVSQCESANDLMIASPRISDLATKIEKLLTTSSKMEDRLGNTLDKAAVLSLGSKIVDMIGNIIEDAETIDAVSSGIIDILKEM